MNFLSVEYTMSRKNKSEKGHRRAASIGTTLDKVLRPHLPLDKSSSANSSFEKGFDKERGVRVLSESKLREEVDLLEGRRRREGSPLILPPRPASLSPTLGADSVSNVSEDVRASIEGKLREDYDVLLREVRELREMYTEGIRQVNENLARQHDYFVEAIQGSDMRMRLIDDRVDDKLDKFHYSSDERIKEIEERLDDYKYKMTRFEELQEQRRMEHPLTGNDIASRGRDVMSSVISLGLATVSLLLFVFTTAVDCLKVFSENNALSTCLSLGLFAAIIATYYYFDTDRTSL